MLGDTFTVYDETGDRYDHVTVHKTLVDYLDRYRKGRAVAVECEMRDGHSDTISNPFELHDFLKRHADDTEFNSVLALRDTLVSIPFAVFNIGFWGGVDNTVALSYKEALDHIEQSGWQSLVATVYPPGDLAHSYAPYTSRSIARWAVHHWMQKEQESRKEHASTIRH